MSAPPTITAGAAAALACDAEATGRAGPRRILAALTQLGSMQLAIALAGLARNKVMAVYLRPEGFGEFTQLAAIAAPVYLFAQFGMAVGLSRNTAAARNRAEAQSQLATANFITIFLALASLGVMIPLLLSPAGNPLMRALGVGGGLVPTIILVALLSIAPIEVLRNNYLCVLQGVIDVKGISTRRTLAIAMSTAAAVPLIAFFGLAGACIQTALTSVLLAVLLGRRTKVLGFKPLAISWDRGAASALAWLGAASLVSAVALAVADTMVRAHLIANFGVAENGQYQAAVSLSAQLTAVILGSVGAYSLATLSQTRDAAMLRERMNDLLRVVLPIGTIGLAALGLFSQHAAAILFSSRFVDSTAYLPLLLAANYVQGMAWVVGAPLLGCGLVRTWVTIQLAGAAIRYGAAVLASPLIGAQAIPAAFLAAMVFDLAANIVICRRKIGLHLDPRPFAIFAAGAATVVAAALVGRAALPLAAQMLGGVVLCAIVAAMAWSETKALFHRVMFRFAGQA